MHRRFQFSLMTLLLLAPAFVLGYLVGQKTSERSLAVDRAILIKKDFELKDKEARLARLLARYPPTPFTCGTP